MDVDQSWINEPRVGSVIQRTWERYPGKIERTINIIRGELVTILDISEGGNVIRIRVDSGSNAGVVYDMPKDQVREPYFNFVLATTAHKAG